MFYAATILALYLLINGLIMISFPLDWYHRVPGVAQSGPFNHHFVVDIGFMFTLSGFAILWRLLDAVRGRSAAIFAAGFLTLHACFHLYELLTLSDHSAFIATDLLGIYLPAALAVVLACQSSIETPRWFQAGVTQLAHQQITNFENRWDYDATYMHELAHADLEAIARFSLLEEFGDYRKSIPNEGWYTAKLLASLSEDCGPCVQLVVRMAEAEGVPTEQLAAVLAGKTDSLPNDTLLFYSYARATLNHELEAENFRAEIESRFGKRAVVAAGMALITGKAFPLMKYATGHGQQCMQVAIDGVTLSVKRPGSELGSLAS